MEFNQIICGDCLDEMRRFPASSIELILTSPPYNLKNTTGGGFRSTHGRGKWKNAQLIRGYDGHDDNMNHDEYVKWQRECLTEMMRLITEDGAIFYNHKWRVQAGLLQDRQDIMAGFPVRQIIIWQRAGGINFNAGYFMPTYEVIYMITKPKFKLAPKANAYGDVWRINQERKNAHPAPFPVELAKRVISSTTAKNVLDPFAGSGTTAIAAKELGVDYICIEKSQAYCDMAMKRVANSNHATSEKSLPFNSDPT